MANYDSTNTGANIDSAVNQIIDSSTDLNIDTNTLVVDKSADSVGIGNTVPGSLLEISKVSGPATLELSSWSATATAAHAGTLKFQKSGTATVNTFTAGGHTTAGEILGRIEAYGVDDADGSTLSSYIEFANDAVSDADSSPGKIVFATSDADDAGTPTVALTIDDGQNVSIAGNLTVTGLVAGHRQEQFFHASMSTAAQATYGNYLTSVSIDDDAVTYVTGVCPYNMTGVVAMYLWWFKSQDTSGGIDFDVSWYMASDTQAFATHSGSNVELSEADTGEDFDDEFMYRSNFMDDVGIDSNMAAGDAFGFKFRQALADDAYVLGVSIIWAF